MTTDPIEFAVDAEMRRRKRNMRIFLALLVLPILVTAAAVVLYTPAAAPDVRPIVRDEVERTIEPQVATQVARQLDERVPPLVEQQVMRNVEPLQGQYRELNRKVDKFDVRLYSHSDPALRTRLDELTREVEMLKAQVASMQKRLDGVRPPR